MSTKNTTILLCRGVPNDSEYEHTLYFETETARRTYFTSKAVFTLTQQSYQRTGERTIKVQKAKEDIDDINYMIIQNLSHEDKWYYCFVKNVNYINDITSEIEYFVDDVQTWLPSTTFGESFVERNHVKDDIIGSNLVPESVNVGNNYLTAYDDFISERPNNALIFFTPGSVSEDDFTTLRNMGLFVTGADYQAFVNLTHFDYFAGSWEWALNNDMPIFMNFLKDYSGKDSFMTVLGNQLVMSDRANNLISINLVPNHVLQNGFKDPEAETSGKKIEPVKTLYFTIPRTFGDYTPKNRKMYTFPYVALRVSNSNGANEEYRFEYFDNQEAEVSREKCAFHLYASPLNVPSVSAIPKDYLGNSEDFDRAVMINNFPAIPYSSSAYREYVNQYGARNATMNISSTLGQIIGHGMTPTGIALGAVEAGGSLLRKTLDQMAEQTVPNQIRNFDNDTNVNTMLDNVGFHFRGCTITEENARMIDDFFTRYGYAQNRLMVPNIHARSRFTYVKTNGLVLNGNLSQDVAMNLQRIFNKGITFWTSEEVGNYEDDNTPLGSVSTLPGSFIPNPKDPLWITRDWSPEYPKPERPTVSYVPRLSEDGIETASNKYYNKPLNVAGTFLDPPDWLNPGQSLGCSVYAYGRSLEIADRYGYMSLIRTASNTSGVYDWKSDPNGVGQYLSPLTPGGYTQSYPDGQNCVNSAIMGGWVASSEPALGSLISWYYETGDPLGHVAVVESIQYGTDGRAESIIVSESNTGAPNPPTGFSLRTVYRTIEGGVGSWYDPTGAHPKIWTGAFALNPAINYIGPVRP